MENILKFIKWIVYVILVIPTIIVFLMADSGNGSSGGGSWKQKRERYERERAQRLYKEEQQKRLQQEEWLQQNIFKFKYPRVPVSSSRSSRSNYAELWDECEELAAALDDAGIEHDDLSYPMNYHELEDLRDDYQSLLDENNIDY